LVLKALSRSIYHNGARDVTRSVAYLLLEFSGSHF
jgi:hypothetical protein